MPEFHINNHPIGPNEPAFIIAEAGINHNGELAKALEMIRVAKRAGADAIKFQTFTASEFISDPKQPFTYFSQGEEITESMLDMFQRYELSPQDWFRIKSECDRLGIIFFSTPQNVTDLELLLEIGIPAVKVGSDDLTNLPLLRRYAMTNLPIIVSCGMGNAGEIDQALETLGTFDGYPTAVLLCTSQYPTPPENVNLRKLRTLQAAFPGLVTGFSDHTQGPLAATLAVAFGASIFEKHFTLDHNLPGPDHWFSEDPAELTHWIVQIRTAGKMLGSELLRPTQSELEMKTIARRSLVALSPIAKGEILTLENIGTRRPGNGLPPQCIDLFLNGVALRNIQAGEPLQIGDARK